MPEFFHKNLEHRPIPPQEEALDVILEKELIKGACSSAVEHSLDVRRVTGSNPVVPIWTSQLFTKIMIFWL